MKIKKLRKKTQTGGSLPKSLKVNYNSGPHKKPNYTHTKASLALTKHINLLPKPTNTTTKIIPNLQKRTNTLQKPINNEAHKQLITNFLKEKNSFSRINTETLAKARGNNVNNTSKKAAIQTLLQGKFHPDIQKHLVNTLASDRGADIIEHINALKEAQTKGEYIELKPLPNDAGYIEGVQSKESPYMTVEPNKNTGYMTAEKVNPQDTEYIELKPLPNDAGYIEGVQSKESPYMTVEPKKTFFNTHLSEKGKEDKRSRAFLTMRPEDFKNPKFIEYTFGNKSNEYIKELGDMDKSLIEAKQKEIIKKLGITNETFKNMQNSAELTAKTLNAYLGNNKNKKLVNLSNLTPIKQNTPDEIKYKQAQSRQTGVENLKTNATLLSLLNKESSNLITKSSNKNPIRTKSLEVILEKLTRKSQTMPNNKTLTKKISNISSLLSTKPIQNTNINIQRQRRNKTYKIKLIV